MTTPKFNSVDARVWDFKNEKVFIGSFLGIEKIAEGTEKEFEQYKFADVETGEEVAIPTMKAIEKALAKTQEKGCNPVDCVFRFEYIETKKIGSKSFHQFSSGWMLLTDWEKSQK